MIMVCGIVLTQIMFSCYSCYL